MQTVIGYGAPYAGKIPYVDIFKTECRGTGVFKQHNCNYVCVDQNLKPEYLATGQQIGNDKYGRHNYVDCLLLNGKACTENMEGINPVSYTWTDPSLRASPVTNNSDVKQNCVYDVKSFDTFEKVLAFQNKFGQGPEFDKIMMHFLTLTSKNCTTDPITNEKRSVCSYLRDNTKVGDFCRNWFAKTSKENQNVIGQNFCTSNPNATECDCINRSNNKIYRAVQQGNPIRDCCWWIPCKNSSQFFVPTEDQGAQCNDCPQSICQQIVNSYNNSGIKDPNISQYISCNNLGPKPAPQPKIPLWETILKYAIPIIIIILTISVVTIKPVRNFATNNKTLVFLFVFVTATLATILYVFRNKL